VYQHEILFAMRGLLFSPIQATSGLKPRGALGASLHQGCHHLGDVLAGLHGGETTQEVHELRVLATKIRGLFDLMPTRMVRAASCGVVIL